MKIIGAAIAIAMTILDIATAVLVEDTQHLAVLLIVINGACSLALYLSVIRPVLAMKSKAEAAIAENEQLGTMRTDFVANVTHELKTPLTSISGFIETLKAGAVEDPKVRTKFLDIMEIETARLSRLINDILVLSDIENGTEEVKTRIDVVNEIESTVESLKPIADKKGVTIITEIRHGLLIRGSSDRFRQMILNLLENAVKYSNDGGRVWIDGYLKEGKPVIRVKDEGIGISQENLDRLFERFYRVDKSRSRKVGGTGLGLSIVKHIVSLFNAEIKVESELGKGTSFYIYF